MTDFITTCVHTMAENGILCEHPIVDGELHRCGTVDKPRSTNGAYIIRLFNDGGGFCWWMNWQTGEKGTVYPDREYSFRQSPEFYMRMREERERIRNKTLREQAKAAITSQKLFNKSKPVVNHPYLVKKQVKPFGTLGVDDRGNLLIPIYGFNNNIQSLQTISPKGDKLFFPNGRIKEGHFIIPEQFSSRVVCLAEGYATGASIHMATGYQVYIAFCATNLDAVARKILDIRPEDELILCADNDNKRGVENNTGIKTCRGISESLGCSMCFPPAKIGEAVDFNDMHVKYGLKSISTIIDAVTESSRIQHKL